MRVRDLWIGRSAPACDTIAARARMSDDPVGLCRTCVHAALVRTRRSVFWRCGLSDTDTRFERYPRLPVLQCSGWSPRGDAGPAPPNGPGAG